MRKPRYEYLHVHGLVHVQPISPWVPLLQREHCLRAVHGVAFQREQEHASASVHAKK